MSKANIEEVARESIRILYEPYRQHPDHGRSVVCRIDGPAGRTDLGGCLHVQQADQAIMTALYWIALLLTGGLFAYLLYAMLRAEDF
jgi:K+-transporting ATPase KdpF subunit